MLICCDNYVNVQIVLTDCPYKALLHGHVSDRLQNVSDRLLLIDYLVNELMGARILQEKKPEKKMELKIVSISENNNCDYHICVIPYIGSYYYNSYCRVTCLNIKKL